MDGLILERLAAQRLRDTYLDTIDWRIFRGGYALRVRRGARRPQATLKSLHSARADLADRLEWSESLQAPTIAAVQQAKGPVARQARMLAAGARLRALFDVRTTRQRWALRRRRSATALAEIALDETQIYAHRGSVCTRTRRVEIEALTGEHEEIRPFVDLLRRTLQLEATTSTKFSAGLQLARLHPPRRSRAAASSAILRRGTR